MLWSSALPDEPWTIWKLSFGDKMMTGGPKLATAVHRDEVSMVRDRLRSLVAQSPLFASNFVSCAGITYSVLK